jgi:hypothetical protein
MYQKLPPVNEGGAASRHHFTCAVPADVLPFTICWQSRIVVSVIVSIVSVVGVIIYVSDVGVVATVLERNGAA